MKQISGRVLRGLLTAAFLIAAGMKLAALPFEVEGFSRFGYPLWFMYAVGAAQLLGAMLLWTRGYVAHGALLLAVVMIGAVGSHLRAGDPVMMPVPAAVLFALLAGLAYARRSELQRPKPSINEGSIEHKDMSAVQSGEGGRSDSAAKTSRATGIRVRSRTWAYEERLALFEENADA